MYASHAVWLAEAEGNPFIEPSVFLPSCGKGYIRLPSGFVAPRFSVVKTVELVLELTDVPTAELTPPKPVAGNLNLLVPVNVAPESTSVCQISSMFASTDASSRYASPANVLSSFIEPE